MSRKCNSNNQPISQHFLTNRKLINHLLQRTSINDGDFVLEIGTGKGHITGELAKQCDKVLTYEINPKLYRNLENRLSEFTNIQYKNEDFLTATLPNKKPYKVFANIPFSRTTEIIRKLTSSVNCPSEMWLIMAKGAAKGFIGKPQDSILSASLKPFFEIKIIYYFNRYDFHPAPSVDVVMLHIRRKETADIPANKQKAFADFLTKGFRYGVTSLMPKRQVNNILRRAGLKQIKESETMLYVQWLCLFRSVYVKEM